VDSEAKTLVDGGALPTVETAEPAGAAPRRVGRFFIFRRIAEGGMGQVLLGYDETLGRKLAIKLWRPQARSGEDLRARMLREAQALARLSHPNVVQVYEVGDHRDQLYLAMEYVEGRTLREWAAQDRPELARLLERYVQAGQGLAAAHRAGVLHRDFKPDNAVVGDDGRVRVLDFGLARADTGLSEGTGPRPSVPLVLSSTDSLEAPITRAGSVLGTPAYMPPEQLAGLGTDARSDVYSFCVALWEAVHGLRPFAGATARELRAAIEQGAPRESRRPVPKWLRAALLRGLAPAPAARWPAMEPLLDALAAGARRRRRRVALAAALAAALLLAAAAAVVLAGRAREAAACDARGAALVDAWSAARPSVRAALLAAGHGFAAHTAGRVDALLDRYAATWSKGQADACRRVRLAGAWSAEVGERADACLDERRLEFEGLVGALAEADLAAARRAVEAAAALPAVEVCLDVDALARRPQLPPEPAARAEAAAVQRALARARSLEATGHYAESLAAVEALVARADALAWPPLQARTRLAAGGLMASLGERDTARVIARFEDALFLALDAGYDATAAEAAIELVDFVGLTLLRPVEGHRWARLAHALLRRLGAEAPPLAAALECSTADLEKVLGRLDAAAAGFERCRDARAAAHGPDHPLVALALLDRSRLEKLRGDEPAAHDLLLRVLAGLEPVYGPDHPTIARVLGELGDTQASLGQYAEAERTLTRARAIDVRVFGPDHERVGSHELSLGQLHLLAGHPAPARDHLARAIDLFEGVPGMGRPMQIAALGDLTLAHRRLGDLDGALEAARRWLALYESSVGHAHASLAPVLVELAAVHAARHEPAAAAAALARARALLADPGADLLPTLLAVGDVARDLDDPGAARHDYDRARALAEAQLGPDHPDVGRALARLGDLALADGHADAAATSLARAVRLLADDAGERGAARFALARARWARGEHDEARTLAAAAIDELGDDADAARDWLAAHAP
jgi:tetratricopeptide (TPR) repeat protein/predicted Ser/Thr protein kinase